MRRHNRKKKAKHTTKTKYRFISEGEQVKVRVSKGLSRRTSRADIISERFTGHISVCYKKINITIRVMVK
ncbi:MAG: hypothetical protein ACRC6U_09355 [Fusobacteriaceae bacterium]